MAESFQVLLLFLLGQESVPTDSFRSDSLYVLFVLCSLDVLFSFCFVFYTILSMPKINVSIKKVVRDKNGRYVSSEVCLDDEKFVFCEYLCTE